MKNIALYLIATVMALFANLAVAGNATIPNTFVAGTPAKAAEVNDNFNAMKSAVDDNDARLTALEAQLTNLQTDLTNAKNTINNLQNDLDTANTTIASLQSNVTSINKSNVMSLDPYVSIVNDNRGPLATFSRINLQLVNGTGSTEGAPNGLGNMIIGYDLDRSDSNSFCSDGTYVDQPSCEGAGDIWAVSHKTGSHYLVIGDQNNYSQYGGLVAGRLNTSNGGYASVSGGAGNTASGVVSSVSGGYQNTSFGLASSVSGGANNTASGEGASVSGGVGNTANSIHSSVSGGSSNTASGAYASVSGGYGNSASEHYSSVSGGYSNTTSYYYSSILGGENQTTASIYQTIPALP